MVDFVDDIPSVSRGSRLTGKTGGAAARENRSAAIDKASKKAGEQRSARATKARDSQVEKQADEVMATRKLTQKSMVISQRNLADQKIRDEQTKRVEKKRHAEHIDNLEKIEKAIRQLTMMSGGMFGGGGGGLFGFGGGGGGGRGRKGGRRGGPKGGPRRGPDGRFIKGGARAGGLARLGALGLGGAGLLAGGATLAASGAGAYLSTNTILNNKDKAFFEGGTDSRAMGYLGNSASGALAGATIGSVVPVVGTAVGAAIGAGVGLIGSVYADYSEEINGFLKRRWKDVKKLAGQFAGGVASMWTSTRSFFSENKTGINAAIAVIPGMAVVQQYFEQNPHAIADAWAATQKFFSEDLPIGIANWKKTIPGAEAISTFLGQTGMGLQATAESVASGDAFSAFKTGLVIGAPFALRPEEGRMRSRLKFYRGYLGGKNSRGALTTSMMNDSDRDLVSLIMKIDERISVLRAQILNASLYGTNASSVSKMEEEIKLLEGLRKEVVAEQQRRKNVINTTKNMLGTGTVVPDVRTPIVGSSGPGMSVNTGVPSKAGIDKAERGGELAKIASTSIREASKAFGTDFGYLMSVAARESQFNTSVKNKDGSSSATGLFQITDDTWKGIVNSKEGKASGLTIEGRTDARQSAIGAAILTNKNMSEFKKAFKREPNHTELDIMHFFGEVDGIKFFRGYFKHPNEPAAPAFGNGGVFKNGKSTPSAANPTIFYENAQLTGAKGKRSVISGRAKSYKEVYNYFAGRTTNSSSAAYEQVYGAFADNAMMAGGYGPEFEAQKAALAARTEQQVAGAKFANMATSGIIRKIGPRGSGMSAREQAEEKIRIGHVQKMIEEGKIPKSELYDSMGIMKADSVLEKYGHGYVMPARVQDMALNSSAVPPPVASQMERTEARNDRRQQRLDPNKEKQPTSMASVETVAPENISYIADGGDGIAILNIKNM